jgi:insulin receptor substrate 1
LLTRHVSSTVCKEPLRLMSNSISLTQEPIVPLSPITKKLSDLSVSKPRLVTASPTTSPTPSSFRSKTLEDVTPILIPSAIVSPLDSEGYEKLQPGATLLHYASLDLPEIAGVPPVSPTQVQEGFNYAEIDFAKLKQN